MGATRQERKLAEKSISELELSVNELKRGWDNGQLSLMALALDDIARQIHFVKTVVKEDLFSFQVNRAKSAKPVSVKMKG